MTGHPFEILKSAVVLMFHNRYSPMRVSTQRSSLKCALWCESYRGWRSWTNKGL